MKKHGFLKVLAVLAAVYAALIAVGTGVFWKRLDSFEKQHPVGAMNAYFAALKNGERDKILADSVFPFDAVNTEDAYWQYLLAKYANGEKRWQYAERPREDGATVYDVYAENRHFGTLTLEKTDDGWRVRSDCTLTPLTVIAAAPPLLDGVSLADFVTADAPTPVAAFDGAGGDIPATRVYRVDCLSVGTLSLPSGAALGEKDADGAVHLTAVPSDADSAALFAFAEKTAKTYAAYISGDAAREELFALMESGTAFAGQVRAYSSYWYNKHIAIGYENLKTETPVAWSAEAFTVDVSFDFIVRRTHDSHTYPTKYRIACRRRGDGFAVSNILTL